MIEQIAPHVQSHVGAIGAGVTCVATYVGWAAAATPLLQVISLAVAISAGSLTVLWYWKQLFSKK